jgi:hypothetical protein
LAFEVLRGEDPLAVEETPQTARVLVDGKEGLKAKFDRKNRLTKLTARIGPHE